MLIDYRIEWGRQQHNIFNILHIKFAQMQKYYILNQVYFQKVYFNSFDNVSIYCVFFNKMTKGFIYLSNLTLSEISQTYWIIWLTITFEEKKNIPVCE